MFRAITRAVKVTIFYKKEAFSTFLLSIFGSSEDDFSGRRDGHFCARDGHYVSNDHRERKNDGFRVAGKRLFSPPQPTRRAYRQNIKAQKAPGRRPNAKNVYLYIIRKIFTIQARQAERLTSVPETAQPLRGEGQRFGHTHFMAAISGTDYLTGSSQKVAL